MSAAKQYEHVAQVKRELAAKYFSLAKMCKGAAKRRSLLFRAEKYTHQAEMLSRKAQAK
jgi:hypothetical protein